MPHTRDEGLDVAQAALLERVVQVYAGSFEAVADGRAYLEGRGITDAGLYSRHRFGLAAGTLGGLLPRDGRVRGELRRLGILLDDELATEIMGTSLDELSTPGRGLLMQINAMVEGILKEGEPGSSRTAIIFTRREVREFTGWANARVHRYLRELVDFEHVVRESGRNGVMCRYRMVWEGQVRAGLRFVPGAGGVEGLGLKPVEELKAP